MQCSKLKKVNLNEGLEKIMDQAFNLCSALEQLMIPASVKLIESTVFMECERLAEITVSRGSDFFFAENGVLFTADRK